MAIQLLTETIGTPTSGGLTGTINLRGAYRVTFRGDENTEIFFNNSKYGFAGGKSQQTYVLFDSGNPDHGCTQVLPYTFRNQSGVQAGVVFSFEIKVP